MTSPTPSQHQGEPVHQTQQTQTQQTLAQQAKQTQAQQMPRPVQQRQPMTLTHPYPHGAAGTPYTTPPTAPFAPRHDPLAAPDGSTPADRRLLAIASAAIILPILCDRLVFAWSDANTYTPWFDGFWLAVIATVTVLFFRTAHRSLMWCFTTIATATLCAYAIAMHAAGKIDDSWVTTTFLAVPCLLMMTLQISDGGFDPHHPWLTVKRWLLGWFSPFTKLNAVGSTLSHAQHAIHAFSSKNDDNTTPSDSDSTRSESHAGQMTTARRILLIIVVAVPLLVALTALLASSDLVFNYALRRMVGSIDISEFVLHVLIIVFLFPFCLSILAQTEVTNRLRMHACTPSGTGDATANRNERTFDTTVAAVVLALVLVLYAMFCVIQFAFLFSGRQLPDGYTYSQYAREGFFQLLAVVCVNLAGYALILCRVRHTAPLTGMLIVLIGETGVMLASALWRLHLYIGAYGLTWLRLESLTFMWMLIAVLILCLVRLFVPRLPLATIGFILVVVWYVALVLSNPNNIIDAYNQARQITDAI
ncbi:DUF4173 domain-containing protein [uncultured Bifidobacterium sp.]|uniref:DUF4153 domain-containing protein n=1 Tax=uncultured Bifidobacterium sp. TaxID=165187 RepID=UPI00262AC810|nr:DUF4173 domain-containing protein [uncultured Bifidobacterium sp.]